MSSIKWHNSTLHTTLDMLKSRSLSPGWRQNDLFLRRRYATAEQLYWKDLVGHFGCVNAIEFSHGLGQFIASGGDDRRVMLWNVEKALSNIGRPAVMKGEHNSNIFCMAFDMDNKTVFSGGNDEQVIVHDLATGETKDVFMHEDAVYGLSPDPTNPNVFASACDDGRVLIYDTRDSCADPFCLANYMSSMHSVMYNPVEPRLLATANAKEGVGLWDVRKPRSCILRYGGSFVQQSCMSVSFNHRGDQIVALRRRLPPVLYKIDDNQPVCEFDHSRYYNSCTMKSICFAGDDDQYVVSGSDEFNLYMWALPEDLSERQFINSAHLVLKGHRSIVNQVRFNPANHLLISSGVEKVVKVWSPFKFPERNVSRSKLQFRERPFYTHEEYINLILQDGNMMSHDYSEMSTEEDPRMMAFFDSLVQRELEGWSSDDSLSSNEEALYSRIVQLSQSDIDSDDSLIEAADRSNNSRDGDPSFSPFTIAFASVMAVDGPDRYPQLSRALDEAAAARTDHNSATVPARGDSDEEHVAGRRDIANLVQRKKKELKSMVARQLKYQKDKSDSSSRTSSCSDVSGTEDTDSDTSGKEEIKKPQQHTGSTSRGKNLKKVLKEKSGEKMTEMKNRSQERLRRLKALRKSVMKSESESEDVTSEKQVVLNIKEPTSSSKPFEKVCFKRLKMNSCSGKRLSDKIPASTDFGPYLQRTQGSSPTNEMLDENDRCRTSSKTLDKSKLKGRHKQGSSSETNVKHNADKRLDRICSNCKQCDSVCECEDKQQHRYKNLKSDHRHNKVDKDKIKQECDRHSSSSDSSGNSDDSIDAGRLVRSSQRQHSHNDTSTSQPVASCSYSTGREHNRDDKQRQKSTGKNETDKHCKKRKTVPKEEKMKAKKSVNEHSTSNSKEAEKRQNDSSSDNEAPTWTEFKRFKNKYKRARRHYRAHRNLKD